MPTNSSSGPWFNKMPPSLLDVWLTHFAGKLRISEDITTFQNVPFPRQEKKKKFTTFCHYTTLDPGKKTLALQIRAINSKLKTAPESGRDVASSGASRYVPGSRHMSCAFPQW